MPVSRSHKLVVLGGERVGKTAIIEQFIFGNHVIGQSGLPTLGDVYEATVETEKGPSEKLQIFDTPGSLFTETGKDYEQEHFLSIADGYVLVYEITSKPSYDLVLSLRNKIANKNKDAPVVVVGNKSDLNAIREVDTIKASEVCRTHGMKFYEVTVLDRDGLKEPMCYMAWRMANPGRPFPSLTASSASRNLAPATTTVTTTKHTNSNKCPPSMTSSTTSSMMSSNRSGCVEPSDEEEEEETEGRDDSPEASWRPIPDDAQFPKNGTGRLFFADCLSSKNKYRDDMI